MELDYSCLIEKPNHDIMTFLETASIRKITISQQSKTCEIFLACSNLPNAELYAQCLQFFSHNMAKASNVRLIVQPKVPMDVEDFLRDHFTLFTTILTEQHPTISGWLYNCRWEHQNDEITLYIGQEIGLRYLQNMQFTLMASILLDEMTGHRYQVVLAYDEAIEKPELKPRSTPVFAAALSKSVTNAKEQSSETKKPEDDLIVLGKLIKERDEVRSIASFADDIAYNNHDIDDGFRAGFFTIDELYQLPFIAQIIDDILFFIKRFIILNFFNFFLSKFHFTVLFNLNQI